MPTPDKVPAAGDLIHPHVAALAAAATRSPARMSDALAQLENAAAAAPGCVCTTQRRCATCTYNAVGSILRWFSAPTDDHETTPGQPSQPSLLAELVAEYASSADRSYEHTLFRQVKQFGPRRTGKLGEDYVKRFFTRLGATVSPPENAGHDLLIDGVRVEVKTSTMWQGTDMFRFSQLRPHADLEAFALLAVAPDRERLWLVRRQQLLDAANGQHTGRTAKETRWIQVTNTAPPRWFGRDLIRHPGGAQRRLHTVAACTTTVAA